MTRLEADAVLLGVGGAGSALLIALDRACREQDRPAPRLIVVDPVRRVADDRTWCFWHEGPHDLDGLAHRAWSLAEVVTPEGARAVLDLDPFRYLMLRSSDVYARAHEAARRLGARWITGAAQDPEDTGAGALVRVGDQVISARWVFDSRPAPPARPPTTAWIQHFRGWTVRFPPGSAPVDVHIPTLMDLSTRQDDREVTFGYVLPLAPDLALVEFTVFSPTDRGRWPTARYEEALRTYLRTRWRVEAEEVRVEAIEDGVIPMTDAAYPRRTGRAVMRLGTAGGATRGSTGYAFAAMYRQAEAVASALAEGRVPAPPRAYPSRHRAIDAVLLAALDTGAVDGAELLGSLWTTQPPSRLLRFLDGTSSPVEELRVMASAPRRPMSRAVATWVARRSVLALGRRRGVTES